MASVSIIISLWINLVVVEYMDKIEHWLNKKIKWKTTFTIVGFAIIIVGHIIMCN